MAPPQESKAFYAMDEWIWNDLEYMLHSRALDAPGVLNVVTNVIV